MVRDALRGLFSSTAWEERITSRDPFDAVSSVSVSPPTQSTQFAADKGEHGQLPRPANLSEPTPVVVSQSARLTARRLLQSETERKEKKARFADKVEEVSFDREQQVRRLRRDLNMPDLPSSVCWSYLASAEGSNERKKCLASIKESWDTCSWLLEQHPSWPRQISRNSDVSQCRESIIAILYKHGAPAVAESRRAVTSFCDFFSNDPKRYTVDKLCTFLRHRTEVARVSCAARGHQCKDTTALAVSKALKRAVRLFGFPFTVQDFESSWVQASIASSAPVPHRQAVMSFECAVWIEFLALGSYTMQVAKRKPPVILSKPALDFVRAFSLAMRMSLRGSEVLSARFIRTKEGDVAISTSTKSDSRDEWDNPDNRTTLLVPQSGFIEGSHLWLRDFVDEYIRFPFIVREVAPTPNGQLFLSASTSFASERCASMEQYNSAWFCAFRLASPSWTQAQCQSIDLTPYAPRHLLPTLAKAWEYPFESRNLLGGWKADRHLELCASERSSSALPLKQHRQSSRELPPPMADVYVAHDVDMFKALQFRDELLMRCRILVGEVSTCLVRFQRKLQPPDYRRFCESSQRLSTAVVSDPIEEFQEDG